MEASGGIPAAEGGLEEAQTGNEQQAAPEPSGVDQLSEKFNSFMEDFGTRFQTLEERLAQQAEPPAEEEPEPEFDPGEYLEEDQTLTAEGLERMIEAKAMQIADQRLKPLQEQWTEAQQKAEEQRIAKAADELEEKYPELQDEQVQERLVDSAMQTAVEVATALGNPQFAEVIWKQPGFLENIHLAMKARERAENEVPAGSGSGLQLERGGNLSPSGAGTSNDDIVKGILSAKG